MKTTESLIIWVRGQLEKRDWLAADLARNSGVSENAISKLLMGRTKSITENTALQISRTLGISLDDMWHLSQDKPLDRVKDAHGKYLDKYERLVQWMRTEAPHDIEAAIWSIASVGGFKDS